MSTTPRNDAGTFVDEEVKLLDDAAGDPSTDGVMRFVSGYFRFKDSDSVVDPSQVRAKSGDASTGALEDKVLGDGITWVAVDVGGGIYKLKGVVNAEAAIPQNINATDLTASGLAQKGVTDGWSTLQVNKNQTAGGVFSFILSRTATSSVKLITKFGLLGTGSGNVRIYARVKIRADETDFTTIWDETIIQAIDVSSKAEGQWIKAEMTFTYSLFQSGKNVTFEIGRDATESYSPTTPIDNFQKAIVIGPSLVKVDGS